MMFWVVLWKITLIGGLALFAGMAVTVTIGGFMDIKRLFARVGTRHRRDSGDQGPADREPTGQGRWLG